MALPARRTARSRSAAGPPSSSPWERAGALRRGQVAPPRGAELRPGLQRVPDCPASLLTEGRRGKCSEPVTLKWRPALPVNKQQS